MKIVVLEGSPNRHASSNLLAEEFIRGAKEAGHTAVSYTHLDVYKRQLQAFSRRLFFETFADMNTPENMAVYLDKAFAAEKIRAELSDENSVFYFLYRGGKLAGYLKLNEAPAQTDIHDEQSLEIERIYVSKEFQGEGLGRCLMEKAVSTAIRRKKKYVWLDVYKRQA